MISPGIALTLSLPEYLVESCKVTLTFESVDEIVWCDHSNESSMPVLAHGAIYFSKFHKMKFGNLVEICFWLNLAVKGFKTQKKWPNIFQVSVHVHPCHPYQHVTENTFKAWTYYFRITLRIQSMRTHFLAFKKIANRYCNMAPSNGRTKGKDSVTTESRFAVTKIAVANSRPF